MSLKLYLIWGVYLQGVSLGKYLIADEKLETDMGLALRRADVFVEDPLSVCETLSFNNA